VSGRGIDEEAEGSDRDGARGGLRGSLTNQQLYLSTGIPTLTVLVTFLVNVGYFVTINTRITSLEMRLDTRIGSLETRLDGRIASLETKFDTKFDILVGKVIEMDNRIVRLEERLKH
jgi:hypothetical protein